MGSGRSTSCGKDDNPLVEIAHWAGALYRYIHKSPRDSECFAGVAFAVEWLKDILGPTPPQPSVTKSSIADHRNVIVRFYASAMGTSLAQTKPAIRNSLQLFDLLNRACERACTLSDGKFSYALKHATRAVGRQQARPVDNARGASTVRRGAEHVSSVPGGHVPGNRGSAQSPVLPGDRTKKESDTTPRRTTSVLGRIRKLWGLIAIPGAIVAVGTLIAWTKGCLVRPGLAVDGVVPVFVYDTVENLFNANVPFYQGGIYLVVRGRARNAEISVSEVRVSGSVNLDPQEYPDDPAHPYWVDGVNVCSIMNRIASLRPYVQVSWVGGPLTEDGTWRLQRGDLQYAAFEVLKPAPIHQRDPVMYRPLRQYVGHGDGSKVPLDTDRLAQASYFFAFPPTKQIPMGLRPELQNGQIACSLVTNRGVVGVPYSRIRRLLVFREKTWNLLSPCKVYSYSVPND